MNKILQIVIQFHWFGAIAMALSCSDIVTGDSPTKTSLQDIKAINEDELPRNRVSFAIIHGKIITGDGASVIEDGYILVKDGIINRVGPYEAGEIPEEVNLVDATGYTLLPGLIDAHFHLNSLDSLPTVILEKGITSLRDPGAWIEAYDGELNSGRLLPRLFLTGPHLDMYPPAYPTNSYILRDPAEAHHAVQKFFDQGASAIKVYFRCSLEIIKAICNEADQLGLPVTAHLEITDIPQAVEAGLDGLEHITSVGSSLTDPQTAEAYKQAILVDNNARRLGRYSMWHGLDIQSSQAKTLSQLLAQKGTFMCPTLGAFEYRPTEEVNDTLRHQAFQKMMAFTKQLYEDGVPVVVGSHSLVRYADYGWAYHHEMELFEEAGFSPLEIIKSATSLNAKFFKIEDRLGTLETGKQADILMVEGDPLTNIKALRQVSRVWINGEEVNISRK